VYYNPLYQFIFRLFRVSRTAKEGKEIIIIGGRRMVKKEERKEEGKGARVGTKFTTYQMETMGNSKSWK